MFLLIVSLGMLLMADIEIVRMRTATQHARDGWRTGERLIKAGHVTAGETAIRESGSYAAVLARKTWRTRLTSLFGKDASN